MRVSVLLSLAFASACLAPEPEPVATLPAAEALSGDTDAIYVASGSQILRIDSSSLESEIVAESVTADRLAATAGHLYFGGARGLGRLQLDGGAVETIDESLVGDMFADADGVYWTFQGSDNPAVWRTDPLTLESIELEAAADGVTAIATDASTLYWCERAGSCWATDKFLGGLRRLVVSTADAEHATLSAGFLYFSNSGDEVWAMPTRGGRSRRVLFASGSIGDIVSAADGSVFAVAGDDLWKLTSTGAELIAEVGPTRALHADATHVYWLAATGVYRIGR